MLVWFFRGEWDKVTWFIAKIKHISANMMSNNDLLHQTYFSFLPCTHGRLSLKLISSWAGVLHLNEVFNVCCFAHLEEDSSIPLMCWTAERCLSRTDFRWCSTTTSQVEQNRRLFICIELPGILLSPLLWCTWLFLWFYF